jgi:hypothetical protein
MLTTPKPPSKMISRVVSSGICYLPLSSVRLSPVVQSTEFLIGVPEVLAVPEFRGCNLIELCSAPAWGIGGKVIRVASARRPRSAIGIRKRTRYAQDEHFC